MTYKDTLFFIGKCLTITHEPENCKAIESKLKTGTVNWDSVVKISTAHYVFPALYLNLQRADFLHYLPEDLVGYMSHITNLNRERNTQIIAQAKEINTLLRNNGITPIFLKGTGNLLEGLYPDIAERMVGDIDFIVSKEDYYKTAELLKKDGYETILKEKYHLPHFRHYPRLHKKDGISIAAIEIHKELIIEKYANEFNYDLILKDVQCINDVYVLSYANKLNLSIIAKQINDYGSYYKTISLRNGYDVYLLSKKTNTKKAIAIFDKIQESLNNFLAICQDVLGKITTVKYYKTKKTFAYLNLFYKYLDNDSLRERHIKNISRKLFLKERITVIVKSFYNKEYRQWLLFKVTDKNWQQQKLVQLGLKKENKCL